MADVRLDRADGDKAGRPAGLAEHGPERLRLDRVAEQGAGAVGLDVIDLPRRRRRRRR